MQDPINILAFNAKICQIKFGYKLSIYIRNCTIENI